MFAKKIKKQNHNIIILEDSSKLTPSKIISEMKKVRTHKPTFLKELKKSLEYANKVVRK